jgi:hypothetical protein
VSAQLLRRLRVKRVDLVDAGDNPPAAVVLYKRRSNPKAAAAIDKLKQLLKGYMDGEARTTGEALAAQDMRMLLSALYESINSIVEDDEVADKVALIEQSLNEALAALSSVKKEKSMDLTKVAPEVKAHIEKLEADKKTAETSVAAITKERDELKTKAAAAPPAPTPTPEEAEKAKLAALPEDIRKRFEANEAEVIKLREERETDEYIAKARALPLVGTTPEKFGPMLRRIAKGKATAEDITEVERLVKSMGEAIKAGKTFSELGTGAQGLTGETAYAKASNLAEQLVKDGKEKSFHKAMDKVWEAHPDLWKQYSQEREGRPAN